MSIDETDALLSQVAQLIYDDAPAADWAHAQFACRISPDGAARTADACYELSNGSLFQDARAPDDGRGAGPGRSAAFQQSVVLLAQHHQSLREAGREPWFECEIRLQGDGSFETGFRYLDRPFSPDDMHEPELEPTRRRIAQAEIAARNRPPRHLDTRGSEASSRFIQAAREALAAQTADHCATWQLDQAARWDAEFNEGQITFSFDDGTVAVAPVQVVGSYDQNQGSFLWGWDHPSVPAPLARAAASARAWGVSEGVEAYTERLLYCSEEDAWDFTAVAAKLAQESGAYRGPAGTTLIFMTFGPVSVTRPQPPPPPPPPPPPEESSPGRSGGGLLGTLNWETVRRLMRRK